MEAPTRLQQQPIHGIRRQPTAPMCGCCRLRLRFITFKMLQNTSEIRGLGGIRRATLASFWIGTGLSRQRVPSVSQVRWKPLAP